MKESTWNNKIQIILGGILLLVIWQLVACKINNDIYIPKLQEVYNSLVQIVTGKDFVKTVLSSFYRSLSKFVADLNL